jgi:class 3 adenylate cyclase/ferritin-like metal-binding protein YciE
VQLASLITNNDNISIQLTSKLVEHLNEALSTENASVDRITSRIDQTPIEEVKQKLKQHLEETHIQKSRLERIIAQLGGKPTDAKADLPTSMQSTTMTMRKILAKTAESVTEDNDDEEDNSMPEEMELMKIKQDFIIEHDELVAYDMLMQIIHRTDLPQQHEITLLLEQSMREEESMAYWYKIHTPLILDNLWPKIIHTSIKRGQNFLINHISSKIPLIIIYADLVGSTTMSMTMSVEKLVAIIRAFTHELSHVVDSYGGYVLKYVGDAVISFFPCSINNDNKYLSYGTTVECAKSMINVIKDEINAILNKRYGYPELSVKIGIDAGENAIVQYGYEQRSPIDILGYTMNVAAKITSLTAANKVSIGGNVYKSLDHKIQSEFHELLTPGNEWKYINYDTDTPYKVYTLK